MLILHRMLRSETYPPQAPERCPDVLATWLKHAPDSLPGERDWEDWHENAAMLHAFSKRGDITILPPAPMYHMSGDMTASIARRPNAPRAVMWGMFMPQDSISFPVDADLLWNNADCVRRVQQYPLSPVFLERCGRTFHVCDYTSESIITALRSLHDAGLRRGFIKSREKGFAHPFDMGEDRDRLMNDMDPEQDLCWTIVQREGERNALFIQSAFTPTYEYRMVVVGNRVVCGAGCIESYTPADSHGNIFDDRLERTRNAGGISVQVNVVDAYRAFATEFARAWAAEHGNDAAYSLDLAIDAETGNVVPIELNPLMNLGLYANRPDLIVDAMMAGADQLQAAA